MKKCLASGHDFNLVMLVYRATPQSNKLPSPAEMFNNRKFRALLPMCSLQTSHQRDAVHEQMLQQQVKQSAHYNKSAKDLSALHLTSQCMCSQILSSLWKPGIVTEIPSEHKSRSYTIQTEDGSVLCHNRRFIKPSVAPQHQPEEPEATQVSNQATQVVYHRPQYNAARTKRLVEEM